MALLELRETQVELHTRKRRIERQGPSVGRRRLRILLLPGERHAQAGEGRGVVRIVRGHRLPGLGSLWQLSLLLEAIASAGVGVWAAAKMEKTSSASST